MAAGNYLPSTKVNLAKYAGMNRGAQVALVHQGADLIIVGDSRLAIQQAMGAIACKHSALQVELARHKELVTRFDSVQYLHVIRFYNVAADVLVTEALDANTEK